MLRIGGNIYLRILKGGLISYKNYENLEKINAAVWLLGLIVDYAFLFLKINL